MNDFQCEKERINAERNNKIGSFTALSSRGSMLKIYQVYLNFVNSGFIDLDSDYIQIGLLYLFTRIRLFQ